MKDNLREGKGRQSCKFCVWNTELKHRNGDKYWVCWRQLVGVEVRPWMACDYFCEGTGEREA
ncbi:MAG: hypothetical protein PHC50_04460 [Candidatus Cloacimonetes bacterium]|nr:hypothetical protein [Candidatus Cloacimonadota bacterium]